MIFVKNSMGGREVNRINTLSKIDLSKIGRGRNNGGSWDPSSQKIFGLTENFQLNIHKFFSKMAKITDIYIGN